MQYKIVELWSITIVLVFAFFTPTFGVFAHNSLTAHQVPLTNTDIPTQVKANFVVPSTKPPTPQYNLIPTFTPPALTPTYPTEHQVSEEFAEPDSQSSSQSDSSDYYDSYEAEDYQSEEDACDWNEFYHVRGKQCVPIKCPKGNHLRNSRTGQCLFSLEANNIKRFGTNEGRMGFKHRNVLKSYKTYRGRGRSTTHWGISGQRKKVSLDDTDTANPVRTIGLIG